MKGNYTFQIKYVRGDIVKRNARKNWDEIVLMITRLADSGRCFWLNVILRVFQFLVSTLVYI